MCWEGGEHNVLVALSAASVCKGLRASGTSICELVDFAGHIVVSPKQRCDTIFVSYVEGQIFKRISLVRGAPRHVNIATAMGLGSATGTKSLPSGSRAHFGANRGTSRSRGSAGVPDRIR